MGTALEIVISIAVIGLLYYLISYILGFFGSLPLIFVTAFTLIVAIRVLRFILGR